MLLLRYFDVLMLLLKDPFNVVGNPFVGGSFSDGIVKNLKRTLDRWIVRELFQQLGHRSNPLFSVLYVQVLRSVLIQIFKLFSKTLRGTLIFRPTNDVLIPLIKGEPILEVIRFDVVCVPFD